MTDFSWTYSCNTTRHGLSAQATIMLETKLISDKSNVSWRTSVSSFISSSIVSNACSKCKQTDCDSILDSREDQEWPVLLNGTVTPVLRKHFSNLILKKAFFVVFLFVYGWVWCLLELVYGVMWPQIIMINTRIFLNFILTPLWWPLFDFEGVKQKVAAFQKQSEVKSSFWFCTNLWNENLLV